VVLVLRGSQQHKKKITTKKKKEEKKKGSGKGRGHVLVRLGFAR